jgi:alpha-galactosidase
LGKKIENISPTHFVRYVERCSFSPNPDIDNQNFTLDSTPQEYPCYGTSDYREPAFHLKYTDGSRISNFKYTSHKITFGKQKLPGLPSTYADDPSDVHTLEITLFDDVQNVQITLLYSVFEEYDAITRSVHIHNSSNYPVEILKAASCSIDFPDNKFDLINLHGYWAKERHISKTPLTHGKISIESTRGSSSHNHNPFIALTRPNTTENMGEVYGFSLIYSGNFKAVAQVSQFMSTRISFGLNDFDFSWNLQPHEYFHTPEVVMVYSSNGLNKMSQTFHDLYRNHLLRGAHKHKERPILINNWEATYFDFNSEKLVNLASQAKELGIELFVLDDGWFGKRNNDKTSLGDWYVNKEKLPGGLEDVAKKIKALDMKFGLWFEPEMVSPESNLYKNHPDWCLHVENRSRTTGRSQLILDYSSKEVRSEILKMLTNILSSVPIDYIKWDMNRNMTEIGSKYLPKQQHQEEVAHRYILGLYEVLEELTLKFPNVLFESCSGGGGRFDPGMLYYMPQTWTSDNTDAIERLKIQYGTSLVYPPITMGAHVSAVPNHQVNRITSMETRGNVAMAGNFGYELDLEKLSPLEKDKISEQTSFYKSIRGLIHTGDFYRLRSPFEGNETAWMFVSKDKSTAFVSYFQTLASTNQPIQMLQLEGLDNSYTYKLAETDELFGGDMLNNGGVQIPIIDSDFFSKTWLFQKVE